MDQIQVSRVFQDGDTATTGQCLLDENDVPTSMWNPNPNLPHSAQPKYFIGTDNLFVREAVSVITSGAEDIGQSTDGTNTYWCPLDL